MTKRKKRALLVGLISLLVIGGLLVWQRDTQWQRCERYQIDMESIVFSEVSTLSERDIAIVVVEGDRFMPINYMPEHYLVQMIEAGRTTCPLGSTRYGDVRWEQADIKIYDALTSELSKTISILELLEEIDEEVIEGYRLHGGHGIQMLVEDGDIIIWLLLLEYPQEGVFGGERGRKYLLINRQTGEAEVRDRQPPTTSISRLTDENRSHIDEKDIEFEIQMRIFGFDFEYEDKRERRLLAVNGFDAAAVSSPSMTVHASRFPGIAHIRLPATNLPENSNNLYRRFPGLRQFIGQDGIIVRIMLADYPSVEEILELFIEDNQDISFEGLVLCASRSIDGERHEINSIEDYFRLRDRSQWEVEEESFE
jgi:hypothetical protein